MSIGLSLLLPLGRRLVGEEVTLGREGCGLERLSKASTGRLDFLLGVGEPGSATLWSVRDREMPREGVDDEESSSEGV